MVARRSPPTCTERYNYKDLKQILGVEESKTSVDLRGDIPEGQSYELIIAQGRGLHKLLGGMPDDSAFTQRTHSQ